MTQPAVPPSPQSLGEALKLAEDILADIELDRLSLSTAALKAGRLARLLNDSDHEAIFEYEAGGYPSSPAGVTKTVFELGRVAGRTYLQKDNKGEENEYIYIEPIDALQNKLRIQDTALSAARDPDISLSSSNPYQQVWKPPGNRDERTRIHGEINKISTQIAARRTFIYRYVKNIYYELRFSGIAGDIFSQIRDGVDRDISSTVPSAVKKLTAIHDNLASDNPEDWSNAAHGCRRLLQDLADALFPPTSVPRYKPDGKTPIKLGADNYINRLIAFVEDRSDSERFAGIVGSHLSFLGDRLDAIFRATQKGSHTTIVNKAEADRCYIYTYLITGDIISLAKKSPLL